MYKGDFMSNNNKYNKLNNNYFYPINNCYCNLNCCNKKNKIKNSSCVDSLFEVENFLCNIKQIFKCVKLIKLFK